MKEVWKTVEMQSDYEVSNLGRVRSVDRVVVRELPNGVIIRQPIKGRVLKQSLSRGYPVVNLTKRGVKKVHRLVAIAHIPNPLGLPCVNHVDSDKTNNKVDNLEWCDHAWNNQHSYDSGTKGVGEAHHNYKHGKYSSYIEVE